jgi:hypothetical protein
MLATGPSAPDPAITDWLAHTTAGGSKAHLSRLLAQWDTASPDPRARFSNASVPRLGSAFQPEVIPARTVAFSSRS